MTNWIDSLQKTKLGRRIFLAIAILFIVSVVFVMFQIGNGKHVRITNWLEFNAPKDTVRTFPCPPASVITKKIQGDEIRQDNKSGNNQINTNSGNNNGNVGGKNNKSHTVMGDNNGINGDVHYNKDPNLTEDHKIYIKSEIDRITKLAGRKFTGFTIATDSKSMKAAKQLVIFLKGLGLVNVLENDNKFSLHIPSANEIEVDATGDAIHVNLTLPSIQ